jgi:hypothetical protein
MIFLKGKSLAGYSKYYWGSEARDFIGKWIRSIRLMSGN